MAVVTSLTPNTTYYFAIKVQDSAGSWSTMSNLAMVSTGGSTYTVTLAWDPSPDATMTNYNIYVGTASGTYDVSTNLVGNVTLGTVTGLAWGTIYYYAVIASDANGIQGYFLTKWYAINRKVSTYSRSTLPVTNSHVALSLFLISGMLQCY